MLQAPFKQWVSQFLNFNRKDRNAIIILGSLIVLSLTGHIIVDNLSLKTDIEQEKVKRALAEWNTFKERQGKKYSLFNFDPNTVSSEKLDSLRIPDFVKKNIVSYREAGGKFKQPSDVKKIYGMNDSIYSKLEKYITIENLKSQAPLEENILPSKRSNHIKKSREGFFDPNTADRQLLLDYGFNSFQTSNILKYRERGGSFIQPEDLLRIYGVDSLFFFSIQKNIRINTVPDNSISEKSKKPEIKIELNSADSAALVKLVGIGPVYASRIIKFRELLGGYHSKEQLLEVYNLPKETYQNISSQVYTDTLLVNKIRLNFTDFEELMRHPYISKEHAAAIINYREENGAFETVAQLNTKRIIDIEAYEKIKPYLSCR